MWFPHPSTSSSASEAAGRSVGRRSQRADDERNEAGPRARLAVTRSAPDYQLPSDGQPPFPWLSQLRVTTPVLSLLIVNFVPDLDQAVIV